MQGTSEEVICRIGTADAPCNTSDAVYNVSDVHYIVPDASYNAPDVPYRTADALYRSPDARYNRPDVRYTLPDAPYIAPDAAYAASDVPYNAPDAPVGRADVLVSNPDMSDEELTAIEISKPLPPGGKTVGLTIGQLLTLSQQYIASWTAVNTSLGAPANALVLPGGYAVANLTADRTALLNAQIAVEGALNARQISATNRDLAKNALLPRIPQFRGAVRAALPGQGFIGAVPASPPFNAVESRFLLPFDDLAQLWGQINAVTNIPTFTAPLTLGGYALAAFTGEIAALRGHYVGLNNATLNARTLRAQRDALVVPFMTRLKQYRDTLVGRFGPRHPFVTSLPPLANRPGSTPDPVNASGLWNPALLKAVLTYSASPAATLDHYELRYSPSTRYSTEDETVVASNPPGTLSFTTDYGLVAPGAAANFRIYVVLTTGNERGSATVKIVRPV